MLVTREWQAGSIGDCSYSIQCRNHGLPVVNTILPDKQLVRLRVRGTSCKHGNRDRAVVSLGNFGTVLPICEVLSEASLGSMCAPNALS